ncbi:MAG: hypothetical protein A2128_01895 [Candidatus Liptonbacteria bacterium GWC1_60_9]|uniref:Uncharacterized protein n=2 Tax=Candidatus Liptoniibacteriota TaxID=1817909 RepID=A0A1G2CCI6_9BACT|nr:MAG: hypothetical protein UZ00_C0001G0028 [Parcubacteria group bacterium GW2011_GWA1_60_11]OGY97383.1 MAG: hypothetical protein A2128_01895 [Candidatus Liptonbacteria bacterium GWC1_60_9]OGY98380.1 MAG: hypothetical protein A3E09_00750 [Candidatus Liptonbacteria bacterium RIFCSPHIGHO2_12_FULL_60_13]
MKSRIMLGAVLAGLALAGLLVTRALRNGEERADAGPSTASLALHATPAPEGSANASSSTSPGLEAFRNLSNEAESLDALLESLPR